jgi:hypothetical protein
MEPQCTPALTDKMWAAGMGLVHGTGGTAADLALREAWKYGAYRGATGTLSFFVNDVPFNPGDIPMNSSTWIDVLCGVCVGCCGSSSEPMQADGSNQDVVAAIAV